MSNEEISEALTAAMLTIELDGLTGTTSWTENGECDKEPKAVVIRNGAYEMME
jgi:branched-chain amino acid transport system substrate-binding protein